MISGEANGRGLSLPVYDEATGTVMVAFGLAISPAELRAAEAEFDDRLTEIEASEQAALRWANEGHIIGRHALEGVRNG